MFAFWPVPPIFAVSFASCLAMIPVTTSCSRAGADIARQRPAATSPATSPALHDHSAGGRMNPVTDRFPGATLLGEAEFAGAVVGRRFRYREIESDLVVERPKELFLAGGEYQLHRLRSVSYGTYAIERGIVSIDCAQCPNAFIGLGRERVFFLHQGRLFAINANGGGRVIELLQES